MTPLWDQRDRNYHNRVETGEKLNDASKYLNNTNEMATTYLYTYNNIGTLYITMVTVATNIYTLYITNVP